MSRIVAVRALSPLFMAVTEAALMSSRIMVVSVQAWERREDSRRGRLLTD
jgi:hypothetical protein